jgi:hypothetical protein
MRLPGEVIPSPFLSGCTMLGPEFQKPQAQIPAIWSEQDNR